LYDGTRLLHHERYQIIKEENKWTDEEMASRYAGESFKSSQVKHKYMVTAIPFKGGLL